MTVYPKSGNFFGSHILTTMPISNARRRVISQQTATRFTVSPSAVIYIYILKYADAKRIVAVALNTVSIILTGILSFPQMKYTPAIIATVNAVAPAMWKKPLLAYSA
jgi:hypothetical protein